MSLFDQAIQQFKAEIIEELEERIWQCLEPRITQELMVRHMSIADTAQYLHVSEQTIRRMVREKELPCFRVRGQIFLRQMDVDEWIANQITERR